MDIAAPVTSKKGKVSGSVKLTLTWQVHAAPGAMPVAAPKQMGGAPQQPGENGQQASFASLCSIITTSFVIIIVATSISFVIVTS